MAPVQYDFVIVGGGSMRLRPREPAVRRSGQPCPGAGGGSPGLPVGRLHPHARRAHLPHRQPLLRLGLRVRARTPHGRTADLPRPRQGARRLQQHQRHDLPARQPHGLRALGQGPRHGALGLRPLPAVLPAHGELPRRRRRRRVPRPRRSARPGARARFQPALPRLPEGRPGGGPPAHRRRQRLPPGGLRALRPQRPPRPCGSPPPGPTWTPCAAAPT